MIETDSFIDLENIQLRYDKETGMTSVTIDAEFEQEENVREKVGKVVISIYDDKWGDLRILADETSGEHSEIMHRFAVDDELDDDRYHLEGRVAIIDTFTILPAFRGRRLGIVFMNEILFFLEEFLQVSYVVLKAHPFFSDLPHPNHDLTSNEMNENNRYIAKKKKELSLYYSKNFRFVSTGNPNDNVMVLDLLDHFTELEEAS